MDGMPGDLGRRCRISHVRLRDQQSPQGSRDCSVSTRDDRLTARLRCGAAPAAAGRRSGRQPIDEPEAVRPAECELIARLATDGEKRELYLRLALHYRELAADMRKAIAAKDAA
jgi:hypothetical protein